MSEPTQNQNQVQIQENQTHEYETMKAPSLCWGTSELMYDVDERDACQHYVHFKRLKLITKLSYTESKYLTKKIRVYYYENPIFDEEAEADISKAPVKGVIVQEIKEYENEYGHTTQVTITLHFLPIQYTLL